MITLTENAVTKVRNLIKSQNKTEDYGLRIYIEGGGCAGFQYGFKLDNLIKETDHVLKEDNIIILLDRKSALYLVGSEIDYEETIMSSGFKVKNPNSSSECGCGISFSM